MSFVNFVSVSIVLNPHVLSAPAFNCPHVSHDGMSVDDKHVNHSHF